MANQISGPVILGAGQWWAVNTSPAATADQYATYTIVEGSSAQVQAWASQNNTGSITGPYASQAAAASAALAFGPNSSYSPIPGVSISPSGATSAANPLTGLASIGDFFSRLEEGSTWIRIAEVILGAALIIVGVAHFASNTAAGRAAAKAGKAAMLL